MEDKTDAKFVRGFFSLIAWMFNTLPILYAIYSHQWLMLGLLVVSMFGVVLAIAIKDTKS